MSSRSMFLHSMSSPPDSSMLYHLPWCATCKAWTNDQVQLFFSDHMQALINHDLNSPSSLYIASQRLMLADSKDHIKYLSWKSKAFTWNSKLNIKLTLYASPHKSLNANQKEALNVHLPKALLYLLLIHALIKDCLNLMTHPTS